MQTPEEKKARQHVYYLKNRDKILARSKAFGRKQRLENWEHRRSIEKKSYHTSKSKIDEQHGTKYNKMLVRNQKHYHDNPLHHAWRNARYRAYKKNLPFTIKVEDLIVPIFCPILNIPLKWYDGKRSENCPSIDQIIPGLGYTPENTAIISWRANRMKNGWSLKELEQLTNWLRIKQGEQI